MIWKLFCLTTAICMVVGLLSFILRDDGLGKIAVIASGMSVVLFLMEVWGTK